MTHAISKGWLVLVASGLALASFAPTLREASAQANSSWQVTMFAIAAKPDSQDMDPRLKLVAPQLRKLFPNHGFKLLDVKSKRLMAGKAMSCKLGKGYIAETTMIRPSDDDGKVRLRCEILCDEVSQVETVVATPPNQLFFCDKPLPDGTRLLIGIGAR
ncbi:hypothetical protein ACYOEI_26800 [Singulisphaera rosea]